MDEATLRNQICQGAHQLWMRGLIAGEEGMITAELHRRRFLITPPGRRRADLHVEDLICVDMGGQSIHGGSGTEEPQWRPHRLAYQAGIDSQATPGAGERGHPPVRATVLASPPSVTALLRTSPSSDGLELGLGEPIPTLETEEDAPLEQALVQGRIVALPGGAVLVARGSVSEALNALERIEHAARVELVAGSQSG